MRTGRPGTAGKCGACGVRGHGDSMSSARRAACAAVGSATNAPSEFPRNAVPVAPATEESLVAKEVPSAACTAKEDAVLVTASLWAAVYTWCCNLPASEKVVPHCSHTTHAASPYTKKPLSRVVPAGVLATVLETQAADMTPVANGV